ncbi:hypothetical protein HAX54_052979 [Datura stramonium]|uniref:Pectinesterase inhibitor domain-containing protein n=1 Tax=Datura stramonium TaxID=4076 RepID=A0ABS8T0S0_DATST|nr:hypothetical protein [Datura stramonium]
MSCLRNISVFSIFFLSFFLLLALQTKANFNSNLIEKACTVYRPNWDFDFCIKLLNSDPKISSSATTPFDLAIAIIQVGNSHASETQDYINQKLSQGGTNPIVSSALSVCSKWYGGVVGAFVTALDDVQEKKFQVASDHIESANDYAKNCEEAFSSRNIQDDGISKGDNLVMYFSLSAGVVINIH